MEQFNAISECIEEYNTMVEQAEKEEEASQELAGGYGGFFTDCLPTEDEEEEDE